MNVNKKVAQGLETRRVLIAAARDRFGADGYTAASLDQIAVQANVTKGALYHHFRDKQDLFRSVYEQVKLDITDQVAPSFVEPEPWGALVAGCTAMLNAYLDPPTRRITIIDGRAVLGWDAVRDIESRFGAVLLRGALRRATNAGIISPQPLTTLAQMLNGALNEACLVIIDAEDQAAARDDAVLVITNLLRGLRTDARTRSAARPSSAARVVNTIGAIASSMT